MTLPMRSGTSYYPERWPQERWAEDAQLMNEIGYSFIRTGEFAWSKFEPADGSFDFAWMDKAIQLFAEHGIQTILCTPTASPMPWMTAKHPGFSPITANNEPFNPGERRHYCFNNPDFRAYANRITSKMAQHFANHPSVIAWQVDNELGGEDFICYCEYCKQSFQEWLRHKYATVENLNACWGGTFFSFEFQAWGEVPVPFGHNVRFFNPSFKKDYLHFYSDSMKDFLYAQVELIKLYAADLPVTTNRFSLFWTDKFDHDMDSELDAISYDNYDLEPGLAAFHHSFYRSVNPQKPYWLLEHHTGLREFGSNPNEVQLQVIQAAIHGATLQCSFSWRQIPYGVEQDFYGVVEYDGTKGETFEVIKQANVWLKQQEAFLSTVKLVNEVAILRSYDSSLIYHVNHMFAHIPYHKEIYESFYMPLYEQGIGVDFITGFEAMAAYKLVVIPLHILEVEAKLELIEQYVNSGGTVVLTGDFMFKTKQNWRVYGTVMERISSLTGLDYQKLFYLLETERSCEIKSKLSGQSYKIHGFFNKAALNSAEEVNVMARVSEPVSEAGTIAASSRKLGRGNVVFLAALAENGFMKELLKEAAHLAGVESLDLPEKVEVTRLYDAEKRLVSYFVMNKNTAAARILLTGLREIIEIQPGEFAIYPVTLMDINL